MTAARAAKLGWIGTGRMGFEMARRLATSRCDLTVWNRTRAKAEPLAKDGAKIVDSLPELAPCDIVFCMVSTYDDVKEVIAGPKGLLSGSARPKMVVECSSISLEGSAELRKILSTKGVELLSAPVSGNAKVIKAGKLTFVVSGPKGASAAAAPFGPETTKVSLPALITLALPETGADSSSTPFVERILRSSAEPSSEIEEHSTTIFGLALPDNKPFGPAITSLTSS